jgi:3-phenylpropionate/cinnamic acid dioxygenase small subunit
MPKNNSLISSVDLQREVENFLYFQAEVLDERRWEEWLGLFADDGAYWMPASKDQEAAEGQPNIFFEDYHLMNMRIRRVEHPYAHSQTAGHRTTHVVSNVMIQNGNESSGEILVTSRFHMLEYRLDDQRYFGGKYTHRLKMTESGYKINLQRVDLVNVEGPFDYVMQVWI